MGLLCLEYRAVSVDYFLDKMQWYEVIPLMTNLHLTVKTGWEQTRELMFSTLSPYMKRGTKLKDVLKFPWDKEDGKKPQQNTELTEEKVIEMKKRAEESRKKLNL